MSRLVPPPPRVALAAVAGVLLTASAALADVGLPTTPDRSASANGRVAAIVQVGGTIYLGGSFTSIKGKDGSSVARNRLAAIDAATGEPTSWNPSADGTVRTLVASPDGTSIFVGGEFSSVGGRRRNKIAAVDAPSGAATSSTPRLAAFDHATGDLDAWNPGANSENGIYAVHVTSSRLSVGGEFSVIGGASQPRFAQFSGKP